MTRFTRSLPPEKPKPEPELFEKPLPSAVGILLAGADHIKDRASQRDCPTGERSMRKTVAAFNAIYGHNLTETEGWQFMSLLKKVRASQGNYRADDHEDDAAYSALAGEAAYHNNRSE